MSQQSIPYMQLRGGSSKGLYFNAADLPSDEAVRNQILIDVMGQGPDQIDGLGGGHPLRSKVAIVSPSQLPDADIDYLFCQVVVAQAGEGRVDTKPNCGNILAGVGPFAIEAGLIKANDGITKIKVHMVNSGKFCELVIQTPNGEVEYSGSASIAGVPHTAAAIECNYKDVAGSACGSLLPTGNNIDVVDGIEMTCIDNGMPVVVLRAADFGISGYESAAELNANQDLIDRLQSIRLQIGPKMNLGDVSQAAVPKMCLVSPAKEGGVINTRTFIPLKCHESIGVLGAVSVATACLLPESVTKGIASVNKLTQAAKLTLSIEHPSGQFDCILEAEPTHKDGKASIEIHSAGLLRTARLLSRGELFVPKY